MRKRLVKVGLLEDKKPEKVLTLGKFLADYLAKRPDVKPATLLVWGHFKRNLIAYFGENKPLAAITPGDGRDFERFLRTGAREMRYGETEKSDGLQPATIRKRIGFAKQFFNDAVEHRLIPENSFAKRKSGSRGNSDRQFFVTRDATRKIIDKCPDAE